MKYVKLFRDDTGDYEYVNFDMIKNISFLQCEMDTGLYDMFVNFDRESEKSECTYTVSEPEMKGIIKYLKYKTFYPKGDFYEKPLGHKDNKITKMAGALNETIRKR